MAAACSLALCGGCADPGTAPLALSWVFADGRSCTDSGTTTVVIVSASQPDAPSTRRPCSAGIAPGAIELADLPAGGVRLELEALSPQGTALYAGSVELAPLPAAASVTLLSR